MRIRSSDNRHYLALGDLVDLTTRCTMLRFKNSGCL